MASNDALRHHGFGHFHEAGHVGTAHVVHIAVGICAVFHALAMNAVHDLVQTLVDIFCRPAEVERILAHFETGSGHAAGVDGLTRCEKHLVLDEFVDGFGGTSHVGDFTYAEHAVVNEVLRIVAVEFVLRGAGQGHVDLDFPRALALEKLSTGEFLGVGGHNVIAGGTQFEQVVDFLSADAFGVVNVAVGTTDSDDFGAELRGFPLMSWPARSSISRTK